MPSVRGVLVLGGGLGLWMVALIAGSPTLHMVAVGLTVLPLAAWALARRRPPRLVVRRRLSEPRATPGQRITVEIDVENRSPLATPTLLLADRVPSTLGREARLVLPAVAGRDRLRVSYTLTPHARGRHFLGPITLDLSDAFSLTRIRQEFDERDEFLVTPEVEPLSAGPVSPYGMGIGLAATRHLFRTGEEFFTMREYQTGDDLRRLHWPSVARTGHLMIRQDESSRRSSAVLLLDTRSSGLGQSHSPAFERGVSAAASLGVLLARAGYVVKLAADPAPAAALTEEHLLEALAAVGHTHTRSLAPALTRLRGSASADTTLISVTAPPDPPDLTALIRAGQTFGPKIAVLIYPVEPTALPPERQAHLEGRASVARLSLSRAGWEVLVLPPSGRLLDVWNAQRSKARALSRSWR